MNLIKLMSMSRNEQKEVVASIDANQISGRSTKRSFNKMRNKQGGFTLLELLVVVGIIAAIAGTATILLRDTDRQAMAAAHVAMMDELAKGIITFQKLNAEALPDGWDSLQTTATPAAALTGTNVALVNADLANSLANSVALTAGQLDLIQGAGINNVRVVDSTVTDAGWTGAGDCTNANIQALITNKANNVTASTIFTEATHDGVKIGCGANHPLIVADVLKVFDTATAAGAARINAAQNDVVVALGVGQNTTLFNPVFRGAMTTVPTYRHVATNEYNRFIALFNLDTTLGEVRLQAVIDGAGDTKDEELGEWDNTRPT